MRKLLLLGTVFFGLSSSALANSVQSDIEVKLEGLFNFQSGFRSQNKLDKAEKNISGYNKSVAFYSEAALSANVAKTVEQITYGGKIVLMPTTAASTSTTYNGSHIFIKSDFGKMELGTPYDAGSKMRITAYDIAAATGDDWSRYAKLDGKNVKYNDVAPEFGFGTFFFDSKHKMTLKQLNDKTEPSRKISYFTPVIQGFNFGISYIPDSSNMGVANKDRLAGGQSVVKLPNDRAFVLDQNVKNAFSFGVTYEKNVTDCVGIKLAATGEYAKAAGGIKEYSAYSNKETRELIAEHKLSNLRTYNLGAILTYGNFSYSVSYGDLGKSLTSKEYNKTGRNIKYYNGAIAYGQGPIKTSVSYFKSNQFKNIVDSVSLGTEYKIAPGLLPYAEIAYFQAKGKPGYYPEAPKKKTKGAVAIIGAKLKL